MTGQIQFDTLVPVPTVQYSIEKVMDSLAVVFDALSADMYDFNYNTIHPYLKIIYSLYEQVRLAVINSRTRGIEAQAAQINNGYAGFDLRAPYRPDTTPGPKPVIVVRDTVRSDSAMSARASDDLDLKSIIRRKLQSRPKTTPVLFSWKDTSAQYLSQLEKISSSMDDNSNFIFSTINRLHKKTVGFHRYFDAGEIIVASQQLSWLLEDRKKCAIEITSHLLSQEDIIKR